MKLHAATHCLDVTHSVLSGSKFDDVNFSGATFNNVNLAGATLNNINMSGWTVEDANMSGMRIHNANLAGVRIDHVNLAGSIIVSEMIDGMTINGVLVTDLFIAYAAQNPSADPTVPVTAAATLNVTQANP
jgi:uncharacterized protein YjbI with pentapeptide repeats